MWGFGVSFYCDESGIINAGYSELKQNTTAGVEPQATTFTIPDGVKSIKIVANDSYPNSTQNIWYKINNPQIVKGDKLYDDLKSGDNCILEETFENKIKNISNAEALSIMISNSAISPMYGKKWMIFGDSTSCYADKNYPDYISEKTNCIISNKAAAGSRITPNEGYLLHDKLYDEPVMDEVIMEETGKVILGFRKSTATVPVNYDFELNPRQFYAVLETEKPSEPVEVAGDGEATKEDLYNALAELGVE